MLVKRSTPEEGTTNAFKKPHLTFTRESSNNSGNRSFKAPDKT
jgi:hypothetical protein